MKEHVHWGLPSIIVYALGTLVVWNVLRLIAIKAADTQFAPIANMLGGALNVGGPVSTRNEVSD